MGILQSIFGTKDGRTIKEIQSLIDDINSRELVMKELSDEALKAKTFDFKKRLQAGETLDELLPEAYAVVREAAGRTLAQRHYDVQLIGGVLMHRGTIAEMRTGEGKTLVATLPAYLNALAGNGVHVVTVNDYLARRDAVWMGQVYAFLGLSVGVINTGQDAYLYDAGHLEKDEQRDTEGSFKIVYDFLRPASKHDAYNADITYGTNNEYGFDFLRDNTAYKAQDRVQRKHHFAIIDEIDSILIDEARTPLIISAPAGESEDLYGTCARLARTMKEGEDFEIDEKKHAVKMTQEGIDKAEKALGIENIYTDAGIKYVHHLETAVRAEALYKKEKEYVVRNGEVIIVDEFTGRMQPGRRWSDGLHQAIEAKEGVAVQRESRTFASITFQNYFRMYKKLAGMTGTAKTSEEEFYKVYGLDTVAIPTHKSIARTDHNDLIFRTEAGKWTAIATQVKELHEKGQPVLLGTVSIDKNEHLSKVLQEAGVSHEVLNAKNHEREGEIVASAGKRGAVTVATNMAGRGVDIKLGGHDATPEEAEEMKALGGLFVLGTERHDARRIDDQLRGRAGRQGDPGETQFFVSLEDPLMRIFASDMVKGMMERLNLPEDMPIENRMINRSLETAQEKIEGLNFDARKYVLDYDDVLNTQRHTLYEMRDRILDADAEGIEQEFKALYDNPEDGAQIFKEKETQFGRESVVNGTRQILLQTIDYFWMDHLEAMQYLRSSVSLRAVGQRDPLIEYKREGRQLFVRMQEEIEARSVELVEKIGSSTGQKTEEVLAQQRERVLKAAQATAEKEKHTIRNTEEKIGRNDIITITNGTDTQEMKYKKAEKFLREGWQVVGK
jgi:preprotein translocase subunit SecA